MIERQDFKTVIMWHLKGSSKVQSQKLEEFWTVNWSFWLWGQEKWAVLQKKKMTQVDQSISH